MFETQIYFTIISTTSSPSSRYSVPSYTETQNTLKNSKVCSSENWLCTSSILNPSIYISIYFYINFQFFFHFPYYKKKAPIAQWVEKGP